MSLLNISSFPRKKTNLPTIVTNSSLVISTHLGILISTITLNIIRSKVSCLITPRSCDTTIFIRFFELIYYLLSTALLLLTNQNMYVSQDLGVIKQETLLRIIFSVIVDIKIPRCVDITKDELVTIVGKFFVFLESLKCSIVTFSLVD